MFKRILTVGAGVLLGLLVSAGATHLASLWNPFQKKDIDRSSAYVKEVSQIVNENYFDEKSVGFDSLARNAIHGMVDGLDPHSEFLESKDNEELEEDLNGEFGGIGIEVEIKDGHFTVISPIPGSPSDRAGLSHGDQLTSIDGKALDKATAMDVVVDKLHGKPKTKVAIGYYRPSVDRHFDVVLVREVIRVASVKGTRMLTDGIGYVQITEFSEHTGEQFADAVDSLLKKGLSSLVIDMRDNPGGLLDAAVEVAEPFFKKGELIVYTQGRKPEDKEEFKAEADGDPLNIPIAILINSGTASAAEIVTGAMKDTHRAVVVGERSFGKGSVQSVFKLKDGEGLRLTTAHYYTPSGVTIHGHGVSPQVEVVLTADDDDKIRLQVDRSDISDKKEFKARFGFDPIEDRQLDAAVDVLKAADLLDQRGGTPDKVSYLRRPPRAEAVVRK
jgi:carboxyl-terminal processing protease